MKVSARILALALALTSVLPGWAAVGRACAIAGCEMAGCERVVTENEHRNCPSAAAQIAATCCRPSPAPWATQTKPSVRPDTAGPATAIVPAAIAHSFDATSLRVASTGPAFSSTPLDHSCILRI